MMRNLYVILAYMSVAACSNERMYQIVVSPDPQGPPTLYPLNFPLCPLPWGWVVIPLRVVIYREVFPEPEYLMRIADGCGINPYYTPMVRSARLQIRSVAGLGLPFSQRVHTLRTHSG